MIEYVVLERDDNSEFTEKKKITALRVEACFSAPSNEWIALVTHSQLYVVKGWFYRDQCLCICRYRIVWDG